MENIVGLVLWTFALGFLVHLLSLFTLNLGRTSISADSSNQSLSSPPTLYQRFVSTTLKAMEETFPYPWMRVLYRLAQYLDLMTHGMLYPTSINHWCKPLDKFAVWKGYLIAEDAQAVIIGSQDVDLIILYAHGGGFCLGHPLIPLAAMVYWIKTWKAIFNVKVQFLSLDYPLSPEHPFPAARDYMIGCYEWMVREEGIDPSRIAFAGDSAGGNLAVVSALYIAQQIQKGVNLPSPPSSLVLISPCFTATNRANSFTANEPNDIISSNWFNWCIKSYTRGTGVEPDSPLISPLHLDDISRIPRFWTCVGEYEMLCDDAKAFVKKARKQHVTAELVVEDANFHNYAISSSLSRNNAYSRAAKQIGRFLFANVRKAI